MTDMEKLERQARGIFHNLGLKSGPGVREENLQTILDALWQASEVVKTPGELLRTVFKVLCSNKNGGPNRYGFWNELLQKGCIKAALYDGKEIIRVELKKKHVTTKKGEKKKHAPPVASESKVAEAATSTAGWP